MKNVLVTRGNGQLASCLKDITDSIKGYNFINAYFDETDITKENDIETFFIIENIIIRYINFAAYTAVDKAKSDRFLIEQINVEGAMNLALSCNRPGYSILNKSKMNLS